jgi:hypothetical protein
MAALPAVPDTRVLAVASHVRAQTSFNLQTGTLSCHVADTLNYEDLLSCPVLSFPFHLTVCFLFPQLRLISSRVSCEGGLWVYISSRAFGQLSVHSE